MHRYYGLDLNCLLGRRASQWRKLTALLEHLPPESATVWALTGVRPAERWSVTDHLLAALVDAVRGGNWQRGGGEGAKPKPIPRPGETASRPKDLDSFDVMSPAELTAELQRRYKPAPGDDGVQ